MATKKVKANKLVIPETLNIKVTKKDIQNGTPGSGENCPIGLAVQRLGFKEDQIEVSDDSVTITYNVYGEDVSVMYNNEFIGDFVQAFDATEDDEDAEFPEPLSFVASAV